MVVPGCRLCYMIALHHTDALSFVKALKPASVACLLTDPPYPTLEAHRETGTTARLKKWFPVMTQEAILEVLQALVPAMLPNAHWYIVCDWKTSRLLPDALGIFTLKNILVWDKLNLGMGYHYRRQHELIHFYAGKNSRKLASRSISDVLKVKPPGKRIYPTEKPVGLWKALLLQSTVPGELVADPWFGSGGSAEAAWMAGCRFEGADISAEAYSLAVERVQAVQAQWFPERWRDET